MVVVVVAAAVIVVSCSAVVFWGVDSHHHWLCRFVISEGLKLRQDSDYRATQPGQHNQN